MIRQDRAAPAAPHEPAEASGQNAGARSSAPSDKPGNEWLPDAELLDLAHRCVEDEGVMRLLLAQHHLPEAILLVLAERLPAASFGELASRHGLPENYRDELVKRSRTRPIWWRAHMASMFR